MLENLADRLGNMFKLRAEMVEGIPNNWLSQSLARIVLSSVF